MYAAACNRDVACPAMCRVVTDSDGCVSCNCTTSLPSCEVRFTLLVIVYLSSHIRSHLHFTPGLVHDFNASLIGK